jgi:hypothetical protein
VLPDVAAVLACIPLEVHCNSKCSYKTIMSPRASIVPPLK